MAKAKKIYKRGATIAEIDAQLLGFNLFGEGDAIDAVPADPVRPARPSKAGERRYAGSVRVRSDRVARAKAARRTRLRKPTMVTRSLRSGCSRERACLVGLVAAVRRESSPLGVRRLADSPRLLVKISCPSGLIK